MRNNVSATMIAALMLLTSANAFAKPKPNPAEFTLTGHVACSFVRGLGQSAYLFLGVQIDGKWMELRSDSTHALPLGDYKMKLLPDKKTKYDSPYLDFSEYELLSPDGQESMHLILNGLGPGTCGAAAH